MCRSIALGSVAIYQQGSLFSGYPGLRNKLRMEIILLAEPTQEDDVLGMHTVHECCVYCASGFVWGMVPGFWILLAEMLKC